jgi:16S rRNA (guanine527-N7)-methyltransferase
MNKTEFKQHIKSIFPFVSDKFFDKIETYKKFLQEENKKINLTNLSDDEKIYAQYFYESIVPYKELDFNHINSVLDIGSGSGIPGILLKLLFNHTNLTIVESNNKKVNFLNQLINTLDIKVNIINKRAENIDNQMRETFDLVTSRAVAPLKIILELSVPYAKVNGLIVEPKSLNFEKELQEANFITNKLNIKLQLPMIHFISINKMTHNVLVYKKIKSTNHLYPRQ